MMASPLGEAIAWGSPQVPLPWLITLLGRRTRAPVAEHDPQILGIHHTITVQVGVVVSRAPAGDEGS